MIKYKLKKDSIKPFSFSYLKDYLEALGIKQTDSFINQPRLEDQEKWQKLDNIFDACQSLHKGFEEDKQFFLQVDSDADGYTSGAIFYAFFKKLYPNAKIEFRVHDAKEHGVVLNTIPITADYVIIPDAGSNQFDIQEALSNQGRHVVILDHHIVENAPTFPNVVVVNNQASPHFENKFLSGAGVVYKTIQAYSELYGFEMEDDSMYEDYADLAALGIVADMMDSRNLDNNYLIYKGLHNIKNPMLKAILEKQEFSVSSVDNPTKIDMAFYVAPLINAVVRYGTTEEKELLFEGMITYNATKIMESTYQGAIRKENYYDYIARTSSNVRGKQNRDKLKCMNFLKKRIDDNHLADHQLLIVTVSNTDEVKIPKTITGLVAMELLKYYNRPTLVLRPRVVKEEHDCKYSAFAGSGRGKANGKFTSLFGMLRASGLCDYVEGHDMAHGVQFPQYNLEPILEFADEYLKDVDFSLTEVEVDYAFATSNINRDMIVEFAEVTHIYGNKIPQPKFAFELNVSKDSIRIMGKKNNAVKFTVGGVDFLKFNAGKLVEFINSSSANIIQFTVIGRAQINEWMGRKTPQIMIDEMEYTAKELENLF